MKREPDQPWEDYKRARKLAQQQERVYLKGKLVYPGYMFGEKPKRKIGPAKSMKKIAREAIKKVEDKT